MAQITISKEWIKEVCQDVIDNALNEIKDEFISKSVIEDIRAEIDGIEINGQVDEHTMFIRTGEQVKQMALDIIDKYKTESEK